MGLVSILTGHHVVYVKHSIHILPLEYHKLYNHVHVCYRTIFRHMLIRFREISHTFKNVFLCQRAVQFMYTTGLKRNVVHVFCWDSTGMKYALKIEMLSHLASK